MKYISIVICLITNLTFGQNVSLDETVRYINNVLSSSKNISYMYQIALSSEGILSITEKSLETDEYSLLINDLDSIYISKDWETCTSKRTNGDSKHIQIWCKNKSDCIYHSKGGEKYTCGTHIYIDLSDYDTQRLLNALKHLITEGKKKYRIDQTKVNDPFAPNAQVQVNKEQAVVKKQAAIQKQAVNLKSSEQCNVKINNRPDGIVVKYMNPELVGKGTNCELGLSIQTTGEDYFLTTTVRYFGNPQKLIGNLKIQLSNSQSLELKLYTSELATMKNEQIGVTIFYLKEQEVQKLKNGTIKTVVFQESTNKYQIVTLNQNFDVAQRHINCLQSF